MTSPFTYVDAPSYQNLNAPPALPTFIDGALVHQADLNALSANLRYLQRYVLGDKTSAKPLTMLRQTTAQTFTTGTAALVKWDTADKNTDSAWSFATDPYTIYVQTPGFYRIAFQGGHASTSSLSNLYLLVNGSDVVNNSVAVTNWTGNLANTEISTRLAATASVQLAFQQSTGSNQSSSTSFGGMRVTVEWLSP